MKRLRKGFTVLEMMVALFSVGLLLLIVYTAFVSAAEKFQIASTRVETSHGALVAYEKMFGELNSSAISSVTISNEAPKAISFLSDKDFTITMGAEPPLVHDDMINKELNNENVEWRKMVLIYPGEVTLQNGEIMKVIYKKEIPYNEVGRIYSLKKNRMASFISNDTYPAFILAKNVNEINFSVVKHPCVTIEVISFKKAATAQRTENEILESMRFVYTIHPRN